MKNSSVKQPKLGGGGSIGHLDLQLEKHKKKSSPKPYGPELSYFVWTNV